MPFSQRSISDPVDQEQASKRKRILCAYAISPARMLRAYCQLCGRWTRGEELWVLVAEDDNGDWIGLVCRVCRDFAHSRTTINLRATSKKVKMEAKSPSDASLHDRNSRHRTEPATNPAGVTDAGRSGRSRLRSDQ